MDKNKSPQIFLNDGSVASFDGPIREGWRDTEIRPEGYTEIVKPLGFSQIIAETAGDFMVYGSAIKYLADIIECKDGFVFLEMGKSWRDLVKGTPERKILFSGGLQIYERGIPGVSRDGFYLRQNGEVWYAENPKSDFSNSLRDVIFGNSKKDSLREKRIEAILRGYESQEIAKINSQSRSTHESYMRGRFDVTAP